jgi:hypothetical protein
MLPMTVVAFDVDLHRVHGYSDAGERICYNAPEWPWAVVLAADKVLVEIASPVDTSKSDAESYNRRKWAIGNSLMIGRLMCVAEQQGMMAKILVSPANKWTLGHPEKVRDTIANCVKEDNHDIRACRAMLHYHRTNPDKWVPIRSYYDSLSKRGTR